MLDEILTVQEIATELGVSPQYVRKLIRDGKLPAEKVGRSWIIRSEVFEEFQNPLSTDAVDHHRLNGKKPKLKLLSFFTGAMGLDIGLERSGFTTMLASEIDKASRETIQENRPDVALIGDIREFSSKEVLKKAGLEIGEDVDLIAGGPPCQAFSTAGNRLGFNDERGNVFLKFIELILEIRPKYAVIENVRGLLSAPLKHRPHRHRGDDSEPLSPEEMSGGALIEILNRLRSGGYGVRFNLYNSANYGAPQKRERVILICCRDGEKVPYLRPTHSEKGLFGLPLWRTFKEAVAGLPEEHHFVTFPEKRLKYYRLLGPGQNWRSLPTDLQQAALGKSYFAGGGKTGFLRRLGWDKPSPTLVTHPAMPATDLAHPELDRPLSVEEYKRVQEFPNDWVICGKLLDQYKQIGNAVPTSLGAAVGRAIVNHMNGKTEDTYRDFPYSRYKGTDEISWEANTRRVLGNLAETQGRFDF